MVVKTITRKETHGTVKEELLNSIRESDAVEEPGLNIEKATDPGGAIAIINYYEEVIKTQEQENDRIRC